MDKNPYDVLGVPQTASADEVKKAYRKKARENHPDINPNDPEAAKRMNEVNEAYDRIINPEKYARERQRPTGYGGSPYPGQGAGYGGYGGGSSGSGYGQDTAQGGNGGGSYGGGVYGWPFDDLFGGGWAGASAANIHPEASATDTIELRNAIDCINSGQHQRAVDILSALPSDRRTARWYYLSALAHNGAGSTLTAYEQIRKAVMMEPSNTTYQQAQQVLQQTGERYEQESQGQGFSINFMSPTLICCACCAMQYLMRMMIGG